MSYKHMSESEYIKIKKLLGMDVSQELVVQVSGRSRGTIHQINVSENYEDYKERIRAALAKSRSKKQVNGLSNEPAATVPNLTAADAVEVEQVSDLTRIAVALERLANAWEAAPKKGLFK